MIWRLRYTHFKGDPWINIDRDFHSAEQAWREIQVYIEGWYERAEVYNVRAI